MIQCSYCQKFNESGAKFCIHCGFALPQTRLSEVEPPPAYAWKATEESFTQPPIQSPVQPPVQPSTSQTYSSFGQPVQFCPRCQTQVQPFYQDEISVAGWVIFALLIVVCFPLFWIGLLIREKIPICPLCGLRLR